MRSIIDIIINIHTYIQLSVSKSVSLHRYVRAPIEHTWYFVLPCQKGPNPSNHIVQGTALGAQRARSPRTPMTRPPYRPSMLPSFAAAPTEDEGSGWEVLVTVAVLVGDRLGTLELGRIVSVIVVLNVLGVERVVPVGVPVDVPVEVDIGVSGLEVIGGTVTIVDVLGGALKVVVIVVRLPGAVVMVPGKVWDVCVPVNVPVDRLIVCR